jgi:hypothetical protein
MAIENWILVRCDKCDGESGVVPAALFTRLDAWKAFQKEGWTRRDLRGDRMGLTYLCADCTKAVTA